MTCKHDLVLAYWPVEGDHVPGDAIPFCYVCQYCGKSQHEIWIEQGQPYAEAVQEGRYPSKSPVPLRKLTKADLKAMNKKLRARGMDVE